jgi:hypothetical protein
VAISDKYLIWYIFPQRKAREMKKLLMGSVLGVALVAGAPGIASAAYPPAPCTNKTISITGARAQINGKPGIRVVGTTTCLDGQKIVPFFRFPGETSYTEGTARPNIEVNGSFEWRRKTGKKFYAYVMVGDVQSNRIIIPAP